MESLQFTPGRAFLSSNSSVVPWTVVFEDEGIAAYFYACDRSRETQEESILDAMLIYNVAALTQAEITTSGRVTPTDPDRDSSATPDRQRLAAVEWSRDGLQAVLYLDGTAQALFDFNAHCGYCRSNFPNFLEQQGDTWRKGTHAWSDEALQRFETSLYV